MILLPIKITKILQRFLTDILGVPNLEMASSILPQLTFREDLPTILSVWVGADPPKGPINFFN